MLVNFGFKTTLIVLITIAMAVMGVINSSQKSDYITPDDGGGWIKTSRGVEAVILEKNGPAARAGILKGDILLTINDEQVTRATDVSEKLYLLGVWSKAKYSLVRAGINYSTTLVITPQPTNIRLKQFLELVGFLYLFTGLS